METLFAKRAVAIEFRRTIDDLFRIRSGPGRLPPWLVTRAAHVIRRTVPHVIIHTWQEPKIDVRAYG